MGTEGVRNAEFAVRLEDDEFRETIEHRFRLMDLKGELGVVNNQVRTVDSPDALGDDPAFEKSTIDLILNETNAVIYCIPWEPVERFWELDTLLKWINPHQIRRITICITKFDSIFLGMPTLIDAGKDGKRTHLAAAHDSDFVGARVRERLSQSDVAHLVGRLRNMNHKTQESPIEIKVMPVSAFGFVPGTGQANLRQSVV